MSKSGSFTDETDESMTAFDLAMHGMLQSSMNGSLDI